MFRLKLLKIHVTNSSWNVTVTVLFQNAKQSLDSYDVYPLSTLNRSNCVNPIDIGIQIEATVSLRSLVNS